jgi:formylglycine-generating enzyme required for sulfatase activity
MVLVSWFGANAYSLWANRHEWNGAMVNEGESFLPTEAQWEYAARGARWQPFPWGAKPCTPDRAVVGLHTARANYPSLLPLADVSAELGLSPFGLRHMAGNVWNWCRDWYAPDFYASREATARNPQQMMSTGIRSERGGSWIGPGSLAASSYRRGRPPHARGRCLGFRCVGHPPE